MSTFIEEEIRDLPARPGVYLMKDSKGVVLYVGKAKELRSRLRSYLTPTADSRPLIAFLLDKAQRLDTIITDTEKEALILENTLIKKYRPRYNISFKDDKNYFSLRIDVKSPFPRLALVRKVKKDGALYFGPYTSSQAVKETLRVLERHFPLRKCRDSTFRNRGRPCVNYEIGRCSGVCAGLIGQADYRKLVEGAILFLKGRNKELIRRLKLRMKGASEGLRFEEAARIRDQIRAIEKTVEAQKAVTHRGAERDVVAYHRQGKRAMVQVLYIRDGKMIEPQSFPFSIPKLSDDEAFSSFLKQFYQGERFVPREILIPMEIEDRELLEELFSESHGKRVALKVPQRGEGKRLMKMTQENAVAAMKRDLKIHDEHGRALEELKEKLRLRRLPATIECVDISNIGGTFAVGSVVRFVEGLPVKEGYRRFRIQRVKGADDYAMMYEILCRHLQKRMQEPSGLPQVLLLDGGRGQLNVALEAFKEVNAEGIEAVALAKGRFKKGLRRDRKLEERIYIPLLKDPLSLPRSSPALLLLQRIRDEAHRFAITYHKKIRETKGLQSILDEIQGIGKVRKKALLQRFGSPEGIEGASLEELMDIPTMPKPLAEKVYRALHPSTTPI